jgi:predicted DNA-binding protein YlxM (UPF0122 family)
MEKIVERTLLFDFYGELLTGHQREVFEDVVLGDLSFSEAAADYGVSRQGIHDLVRRVDRQLLEYESRLHLVARFLEIRRQVEEIRSLTEGDPFTAEDAVKVREICDGILKEL